MVENSKQQALGLADFVEEMLLVPCSGSPTSVGAPANCWHLCGLSLVYLMPLLRGAWSYASLYPLFP